MSLLLFRALKK